MLLWIVYSRKTLQFYLQCKFILNKLAANDFYHNKELHFDLINEIRTFLNSMLFPMNRFLRFWCCGKNVIMLPNWEMPNGRECLLIESFKRVNLLIIVSKDLSIHLFQHRQHFVCWLVVFFCLLWPNMGNGNGSGSDFVGYCSGLDGKSISCFSAANISVNDFFISLHFIALRFSVQFSFCFISLFLGNFLPRSLFLPLVVSGFLPSFCCFVWYRD